MFEIRSIINKWHKKENLKKDIEFFFSYLVALEGLIDMSTVTCIKKNLAEKFGCNYIHTNKSTLPLTKEEIEKACEEMYKIDGYPIKLNEPSPYDVEIKFEPTTKECVPIMTRIETLERDHLANLKKERDRLSLHNLGGGEFTSIHPDIIENREKIKYLEKKIEEMKSKQGEKKMSEEKNKGALYKDLLEVTFRIVEFAKQGEPPDTHVYISVGEAERLGNEAKRIREENKIGIGDWVRHYCGLITKILTIDGADYFRDVGGQKVHRNSITKIKDPDFIALLEKGV